MTDSPDTRIEALLASGEYATALEAADEAIQVEPDDGVLLMLRGIALGQLGRVDEARGELRRATMLSPSDPRTFYNLGVLLYDEGDREEAAAMADQALKLDPAHGEAAELLRKCQMKPGEAPFEVGAQKVAPTKVSVREGQDDPVLHVLGLGEAWTRVGIGLVMVCVVGDFMLFKHPPSFVGKIGLRPDPLAVLATFLWVTTSFATLFWMIVDIFDRRERFVWLLPVSVCGLVGLPIVPLGLYLWIGRRK